MYFRKVFTGTKVSLLMLSKSKILFLTCAVSSVATERKGKYDLNRHIQDFEV